MSACHLLSPLLIEELDAAGQGLDGLFEAAGPDNVLQVLQHALIMLCLTFRLHHGNLFHLTLCTIQNNTWTKTHMQSFKHKKEEQS